MSSRKEFLEMLRARKWEFLVLLLILSSGIFLRTYHFSDWLHFEIDQVFDVELVAPALSDGIENLPLLGPNVGGGTLRLGPAFYYLEYLGALLFGNTPTGHAATVLILSILALPLFYVFCQRYFSVSQSLGLLAIFSTSLFSVLYARFSWSPNVLPFLTLFSFYALLRSVSSQEKNPARWFLLSVTAVTITSQIHFNSLFAVPLITVIFIAIKRPTFNWKVWLSAAAIIVTLYSPVILSDIKTNGSNLADFKVKIHKTGNTAFSLDTTLQTALYDASEYFFINTSSDQINGVRLKDNGFACNACQENIGLRLLALALFLSTLFILALNLIREKDPERRNFLILVAVWSLVSFALFYTVAKSYRVYPRFFLIVSPLAILSYGLLLRLMQPEKNWKRLALFVSLIACLVFLNVQKVNSVFAQLRNNPVAVKDSIDVGDIFPDTNRITLAEQERIVDFIQARSQENNFPVYLGVTSEYAPSFWYLLEKRGVHYFDDIDRNLTYAEGNYFQVTYAYDTPSQSPNFREKDSALFGKLRIQSVEPLQPTGLRQPESEKIVRYDLSVIADLLTWKKLFQ